MRTPYEAGARAQDLGLSAPPDVVDALVRDAPFDYGFGNELLRIRYGDKAPYAEVLRVFNPRLEYDLLALRVARDRATDPEERLKVSRTSCADLIVGLEGWRVDNLPQYRAINAFFKTEVMKITAWRTTAFDVTVTAPNRLMGIEFRSHPIKGWAEE